MNYEVVEIEEKYLVGKKIRTTNEDWKCIQEMGALWQNFHGENFSARIDNVINSHSYGVYNNYESDLTKPYDYTAAVEVSECRDDTEEESFVKVPKGKYARFTGKGNVQEIVGQLWQQIWESDLKRSYLCDFEQYNNDSTDMNDQTVEVYISIS